MSSVYLAVIVVILCGTLTPVLAENATSSYSLTAAAGGFGPLPILGLRLGYDVTGRGMADSFGVEGSYLTKWSDRGNANLFNIEVIVPVTPGKSLVPFLAAGPGAISGSGADGFALSLAFGGGVKYFVSDNLALRGDLRDMLVSGQKPSAGNIEYTVGLSWIFGKKEWSIDDLEKKNAAAREASLPSGATSEGSNKAEGPAQKPVAVAASTGKTGGEPTAAPGTREKGEKNAPAAAGKEDGAAAAASSGAVQQKAEHPEKGSAEPERGANPEKPAAASGAGSDGKSRPQPAPVPGGPALSGAKGSGGASVLQAGPKKSLPAACQEPSSELRQGRSLKEVTVSFALNKTDISRNHLRRLRDFADYLKLNSGVKAVISGHTDITGPLRYNLELSRRRAESVKRSLVQMGIAASRLITKGYGPCTPIAGMPFSARENRRATAVVTLVNSP